MRGIMRSFGEILASLREERGIYQKELAAILKVSVGTISNYENNIHFPDQEALIQLAEYFDVTIDYLLGGTDKLEAFKNGHDVNAPKDASNNTRFVIMNYFREMAKQGREVDSEIEGRVTVK